MLTSKEERRAGSSGLHDAVHTDAGGAELRGTALEGTSGNAADGSGAVGAGASSSGALGTDAARELNGAPDLKSMRQRWLKGR